MCHRMQDPAHKQKHIGSLGQSALHVAFSHEEDEPEDGPGICRICLDPVSNVDPWCTHGACMYGLATY